MGPRSDNSGYSLCSQAGEEQRVKQCPARGWTSRACAGCSDTRSMTLPPVVASFPQCERYKGRTNPDWPDFVRITYRLFISGTNWAKRFDGYSLASKQSFDQRHGCEIRCRCNAKSRPIKEVKFKPSGHRRLRLQTIRQLQQPAAGEEPAGVQLFSP